ncbi:MAG: monovalent cation:proton antiporter-2 (CPA2) family protein [Acuticoccus sp.]
MEHGNQHDLLVIVIFLATAVVFVPFFKRFGLGSVLGYLAAGVLLGPHVLRFVHNPEEILSFAELGVAFLLFLIGLELNPSRLWAMRRDIFGLGLVQIVACGAVLMLFALLVLSAPWQAALVAGMGLALSSTALVMQVIEERGAMRLPYGQKTFAILLMQDLAIVPLLLLVSLLSPGEEEASALSLVTDVAIAVAAVAAVVLVGRYLVSQIFRILARHGGREIMTAGALLVVLAAGLSLTAAGLSMAMGAFLAGVLLAESNYRRELEADIEPFRGLLLGLFFISVGMSLDLGVIGAYWAVLIGGVVVRVVSKLVLIYGLARGFGSDHATAAKAGILLSQGGEFGFVLFAAAARGGVISEEMASLLVAIVVVSMATTPLLGPLAAKLLIRSRPAAEPDENYDDADGEVLIIGFGRFGQFVSQMLLVGGHELTVLDNDAERVTEARRFGERVYYGDGKRLDVLRAAGAERARLIAVCTDEPSATTAIVELVKAEFPHAEVFARAFDRRHALTLFDRKVDYQRRETFDSALRFGRDALVSLGFSAEAAKDAEILVRRRDRERLEYQRLEGLAEGHRKWAEVTPQPFDLEQEHRRGPDAEAAE